MTKSFRILRVSHLAYPTSLVSFFEKYPNIHQKSYSEQLKLFFAQKLGYGDSFSRAMNQLGHQVEEVVDDLEWLQKTWAKENSIAYSEETWHQEILLAQIQVIRPEILYFQHTPLLPYEVWRNLKYTYPCIKKIVVHRAFPGDFDKLGSVDLLMVGTRHMVTQYANHGIESRLLYHYFDETIPNLVDQSDPFKSFPLTFLGSSGYAQGWEHATRYWLLQELLRSTSIEMWLEEPESNQQIPLYKTMPTLLYLKYLVRCYLKGILDWFPSSIQRSLAEQSWSPKPMQKMAQENLRHREAELEDREAELRAYEAASKIFDVAKLDGLKKPQTQKTLRYQFPNRCHPPVFGLDYYRILAASQISFNRHTDAAMGDVGNIRLFQATGMGSCLLTDTGRNMSDLFEADVEVVTYTSMEEAIEKINYLLDHKSQRQEIAEAGRKRTLRDHTALKRCEQISEWLQEIMD